MARRQRRARKVQIVERLGIKEKTIKERAKEFGLRTFWVKEEKLKRKSSYLERLAKESAEKDLTYTKLRIILERDGIVKPSEKIIYSLMEKKWKKIRK